MLAILLCFAMAVSVMSFISPVEAEEKSAFSDVKGSEYYAESAGTLAKLGILTGYKDGTFGAEKSITRAEMAAVICRMIDKESETEKAAGATDFDDVAKTHWASGYINTASAEGIINGDGNGKFRPEDEVKYEEAVKMVVCALGLGDEVEADAKDWSKGYLAVAEEKSITDSLKGKKGEAATRADISVMVCNALISEMKAPEVSVEPGEYKTIQTVKLTTETAGAVIYYTVDGTDPLEDGKKYDDPIKVLETLTIKAVAVKGGVLASDVTDAKYTIVKEAHTGSGSSGTKKYTLNFESTENGTLNSDVGGKYKKGAKITLTATPNERYAFVKWVSDNGGVFEDEKSTSTTFTMPSHNTTISALFVEKASTTLPKDIAELLDIDPDDTDTDGDGLNNYVEVFVLGIDPKLKDTDNNGVSDADEDADGDRLTNIEEVTLGTDPTKADTDDDGLSDYDEINVYNTDPCNADTDGDGLNDGDEVLLGLDPNKKKTDGKTLDSKRKIEQIINSDNIDENLMSDENSAIPSLTVLTEGNANETVRVQANETENFGDSRSLVGEAIDISGLNGAEGELSFDLAKENELLSLKDTDEKYNTKIICKYTDDSTKFIDTIYDEENNTLNAKISGDGMYFVLDVKVLFDELGLEMPEVSNVGLLPAEESEDVASESEKIAFSLMEEGAVDNAQNSNNSNVNNNESVQLMEDDFIAFDDTDVEIASDDKKHIISTKGIGAMAQADIVFVIDTTGSMGDEINNVKNNINAFVDVLKSKGVSAGLALIDYQDITHDGYDSTRVHKNGTSNWFYDIDAYKEKIAALYADDGGDLPECAVDALETARLLDMRASAGKVFVLVTDASYKVDNRYGIPSMDAEIQLLNNIGIKCFVVSTTSYKNTYKELYTKTGGDFADINGNFAELLIKFADKIGEDIVGDGYLIYLQGPIPVAVMLDEKPSKDSLADTDGDGVLDRDELDIENPGKIDLDELLTKVSRGIITDTRYGIVETYRYKSDPTKTDTDFDGIPDDKDILPRDNVFCGTMNNEKYGINEARYTFDYRYFLRDSKDYNYRLSTDSLIFANMIYSGGSFDYSKGIKGKISDAKLLMETHGFKDVVDYNLAVDYNDDDISEICIGYHDVEFNEKSARVFGVIIRGTNGTIEEWSSNFDIGNREEWKSDNHKGFSVTAERIKKYVDAYAEKRSSGNNAFWITGHSRGAGIANLLASMLINEDKTVFAYTFASPATTIDKTATSEKYDSIKNIVNIDDVVTYVPLSQWNFYRYGVTKPMIMDSYLKRMWSIQTSSLTELPRYNALNSVQITQFTNNINNLCCNKWDDVYKRVGKQEISEKQKNAIPERALAYCDIVDNKVLGIIKNGYDLHPSLAFIFQLGAEAFGGYKTVCDGSVIRFDKRTNEEKGDIVSLAKEMWNSRYSAALSLFLLKNKEDAVVKLIKLTTGEMDAMDMFGDAHSTATYYIINEALR